MKRKLNEYFTNIKMMEKYKEVTKQITMDDGSWKTLSVERVHNGYIIEICIHEKDDSGEYEMKPVDRKKYISTEDPLKKKEKPGKLYDINPLKDSELIDI